MFQGIRNFLANLPLSRNSLLIIGLFIVLAAIPLTVFLSQQQQEIRQRAAAGNNPCRNLPGLDGPDLASNNNYFWRADCNHSCSSNNECPQNKEDVLVTPKDSNWCYGFDDRNYCLQLRRAADPVPAVCNLGGQSPSVSQGCALCLLGSNNQLQNTYNDAGHDICDNIQIVNHWCNELDPAGCNNNKTRDCASQCGVSTPVPGASINATPNPVPAAANGLTTITWSGVSSSGQVRVYEPDEPTANCKPSNKCLFAQGSSGSQQTNNADGTGWIQTGHTYKFDLYQGSCTRDDCSDQTLADSATVTKEGTATPTPTGGATPTPIPPPGQCTLSANFQTPNRGGSCASCIITNRPDLRPFFNANGHSVCTDTQIVNHWCNGGISNQASQECTALVNGACANQCGVTTGATLIKTSFTLQSVTAPKSARTLKVEIFNTSNQLIGSARTARADFDASPSTFHATVDLGAGWTTGPYVVKIKVNNTLRKLAQNITNIASGQVTALPRVELLSGDVNDDNKLDAVDYANIVGCLDANRGTSAYNCPGQNPTLTDLNDDGSVTVQDLGILIFNFSHRTGD